MEQHGRQQMEPELVLLNYCKWTKSLFTPWDFIIGTQSYRPVRYSIVKIIIILFFLRIFVLITCFTSYAKAPSWNRFISVFQKQMKTRSAVQLAFLFLLLKKNPDLNRSPESCIAADWNKKKNYTSNLCGVWKCQLVGMWACGRLLVDPLAMNNFCLSVSSGINDLWWAALSFVKSARELLLQLTINRRGFFSHWTPI